MVDQKFMDSIDLTSNPLFQKFIARFILTPNYRLFAKVDIQLENIENIPKDETVIFAMNHTDRFNYWPFQYQLWREGCFPFTTVWVKGKYFNNAVLGNVLKWCNALPVPSKKYLIEEFFKKQFERKLDFEEYRLIKDVMDMKTNIKDTIVKTGDEIKQLLSDSWKKLTNMKESFIDFIDDYHRNLMERASELSLDALFNKNLNIIIFPEGTRSVKLAEGRTGLAQLALKTEKKIVPVGCNNSEQIYPGSSPFAKSGRVTYRIGKPISVNDRLKKFKTNDEFKLFSKESQEKYKEKFEAVTEIVMGCIYGLLDEKYTKDQQ